MWPHRQQPTRLPHPWDSPGKNTGVGCHFLLQCMKVKSESEDAQLYPTLRDPIDCSLPGSSAWDFPGKSTGAGYHCLLHKQAWACAKLPQFCPTLCDLMHCSPPGSSVSTASKQYSPGKNTGVGCHSLLQCTKVKSESEVAQSPPTLHDPTDSSPPGSPVHGTLQARVLEWDWLC